MKLESVRRRGFISSVSTSFSAPDRTKLVPVPPSRTTASHASVTPTNSTQPEGEWCVLGGGGADRLHRGSQVRRARVGQPLGQLRHAEHRHRIARIPLAELHVLHTQHLVHLSIPAKSGDLAPLAGLAMLGTLACWEISARPHSSSAAIRPVASAKYTVCCVTVPPACRCTVARGVTPTTVRPPGR